MNTLLQAFTTLIGHLFVCEFMWSPQINKIVTVWANPAMFAYKLKFILLPQPIATLDNYVYSLFPLANVDSSAFPECFLMTIEIHDWWNGTKGGFQFSSGDLIWLPLSVHICLGFVLEYCPFVGGCTRHGYSKLYYLCPLASLLRLFPTPTSPLYPSCQPFYICWPNINEFHEQIVKKWRNQSLSTCQISCTKANSSNVKLLLKMHSTNFSTIAWNRARC